MHKMFIINSGIFFSAAWVIVKPWIDPVTQKKITIINGSGKKELLQDIHPDSLPNYLGGNYQGDLLENHGPWKEALDKSLKNKSVRHNNTKMVDQFYLTQKEFEEKYK